jgi:hypothetical protein
MDMMPYGTYGDILVNLFNFWVSDKATQLLLLAEEEESEEGLLLAVRCPSSHTRSSALDRDECP